MFKSATYLFFIFLASLFARPSLAQTLSVNTIGNFEFKILDKMGWKATPEARTQSENILKYEGIKLLPSFAYTNNSGALIYGTLKFFRDGLTFTTAQLVSVVPQFPEAWGIKKDNISNASVLSDYGFEYAVMRAIGPGDGKVFGRGKSYKTLGVWIDIPIQYQDVNGYHSVLLSIFYRGFHSQAFSDEKFLKSIMNSFSPVTGTSIITEKKYKEQFQPVQTGISASSKSELQKSAPSGVIADNTNEPQKSVQAGINVVNTTEPQKSAPSGVIADNTNEPQKSVQAGIGANSKTEPQKIDFSQKNKDAEVPTISLLDIVRRINLIARPEVSSQSNVVGNGSGCESFEIINEQNVSLLSLYEVVAANYKSHHKCVATFVSRSSGVVNSGSVSK